MTQITLKGLIYGQPGIGKTSLAISAPKTFIIDTENGLKRVSAEYRAMTGNCVANTYQEILDLVNSDKLDKYQTIVIDTAGRLVDKMNDYLAISNPKQKKGDGSPSMQGWGAIKHQFSNFLKLIESKNKSIIFVAHEKEEKIDEKMFKRPDIAGSSGKELVKDLDFIGYMSKVGNKITVDFNPSESYYAKNSIGTNDFIEVPRIKGLNNFLTKEIFEKAAEKKVLDAENGAKFSSLISEIKMRIEDLKSVDDVNNYFSNEYQKHTRIWSSPEVERDILYERVKELNLTFDKSAKLFKGEEDDTMSNNAKPA